jgi:hypothetical protein
MGESNERLRQARKAAGYSAARRAALKFHWNPSTYSSHENGQTPVPVDAAFEYGKAFKTSAIWILHGVGPRQESIDAMLAGQPENVWNHARDAVATILKHRN